MITTIIVVDSFIEGALYNTLSFLKHSSCVIVKLDIYSTTKDNIHTKIQEYITNEMETQTFNITKIEAEKAFKIMNVSNWKFLEIPATTVHQVPAAELNDKINDFLKLHSPDWVFIPFPDRHIDHRTIFDASVVSCRPSNKNFPKVVLAYETLSETHWNVPGVEANFIPEFYVNADKVIEKKIKALNAYKSQLKNNSSRSVEACKALAFFRGSQNGCSYAEAFKVVRIVV